MTWAIDESRPRLSNRLQLNCHRIAVAYRWALKARSRFNAVGLIKQLANGDSRFAWITLPFSDGIRDEIVELKQSIVHRSQRGDSPKTFCPAEDRPSSPRRSAIRIMLKNRPPILHHQHGDSASALGIFCRTRAIG